ncbi:MAG: S1 RNA-binding domain-containing protein [Deltaproteobacteria bacterium]|nr:S1 RNA-binding domain-containing protein [Deltaproteobacteria bacterium]
MDNFEQMLNESLDKNAGVAMGEKITATIVSIGSEYIFLDLGMRSEGMILRSEFEKEGELTVKEGQSIDVVTVASKDGAVMCATRMGHGVVEKNDNKSALAARVKDAFDAELPVEGKVKGVNKGGFDIDIFGLRAFCPISQIDTAYCEKPDEHLEKTYLFKISRFENDGANIIVSRREILKVEEEEAKKRAFEILKAGDVIDGTVSNLMPYGAFVKIGGVEGLLHVSQISHTRINHPDEVLTQGQPIKVQISDINRDNGKISLSLKSLLADPWDEFIETVKTGSLFNGTVSRIMDFGAFVEILPGIEGLVHVSQMKTGEHVNNPRRLLNVKDSIEVRILDIDPDNRKISLTMVDHDAEEEKQATEDFRSASKAGSSMGTFGDLLNNSISKK